MIVPGSIFGLVGAPVDHPFSWYAVVKEKVTGKQWTYWFNGVQLNREAVAAHIALHYRNVEVVTIDPCTTMPTRALQPIPANHFQFGVFAAMRDFDRHGKPALLNRTPIHRAAIRRPVRV